MQWKQQALERFSNQHDAHKWAAIYAADNLNVEAINFRKRRDVTVQYVLEHMPAGADILDLGCGAGPVLVELCNHPYNLIGIDYSGDMLRLARKQLGSAQNKIPLLQGECEAIPLSDASIDCVLCLGVISYAESIENALQNIFNVLRPGGTAIVTYRNSLNDIFMDPVALIKQAFEMLFRNGDHANRTIGRSIPRSEFLQNIRKTQFKVAGEHQIGFGTLRLNRRVISDGRMAIRLNGFLHKLLSFFPNAIYRAMADVHIIILKK